MELLGEGRTRMQEGQRGWSDPGKRYRAKYWQEVIAMPWVKEMTNLLESIKPIRRLQSDKMLAPRGRDVIEEEASWRKFVHYRKYSVIACIRYCAYIRDCDTRNRSYKAWKHTKKTFCAWMETEIIQTWWRYERLATMRLISFSQ